MEPKALETEIKNLRIEAPAKERFEVVIRAYKAKHGVCPTFSEALILVSDYYLLHALGVSH